MQTITSKKLYGKLYSFICTVRDGTTWMMVKGQQAFIYFLQTKLAIYEEKFKEATGRVRHEFNDTFRTRMWGVCPNLPQGAEGGMTVNCYNAMAGFTRGCGAGNIYAKKNHNDGRNSLVFCMTACSKIQRSGVCKRGFKRSGNSGFTSVA